MPSQHLSSSPCILAIGGLDPSGGAGLPADARAAAAFGVHVCGVATAVIAQNTRGVSACEAVSPAMLEAQLAAVIDDIPIAAVKIGALFTTRSVQIVAEALGRLPAVPVVLDTVFAPSTGPVFSDDATVVAIIEHLFSLATLVTPNIPEIERITGINVADEAGALRAGRELLRQGVANALIKGGHASQNDDATDWLVGNRIRVFSAPRQPGIEVRGTGCMLASAIAAELASGADIETAIAEAKRWLTSTITAAAAIGGGRRVGALPQGGLAKPEQ